MKNRVNTNKWTWYEWKKAANPDNIKRTCSKDWVAATPDLPCPEVVKKYRQNCKVTNSIEHCFGARAFKFIDAQAAPAMSPDSGVYFGKTTITVTSAPKTTVACTIDGSAPNAANPASGTIVDGRLDLSIDGNFVVKCQAIRDDTGGSAIIQRKYRVVMVSPRPTFSPNGGIGVIGFVSVTLRTDVDDCVIYFTTDGTQASKSSPVYSGPIQITKNGTIVHAISTHAKVDDSPVAESEPFTVQTPPPVISPEGGIGVGLVKVSIQTQEGDRAYCTINGKEPTVLSKRCDGGSNEPWMREGKLEIKRNDVFVRAIAVREGLSNSPVAVSGLFAVHAHPPHCDPNGGSYEHIVQVSLQYPGEGFYQVLYTTDGSIPWPDPSVVQAMPSGDRGQGSWFSRFYHLMEVVHGFRGFII